MFHLLLAAAATASPLLALDDDADTLFAVDVPALTVTPLGPLGVDVARPGLTTDQDGVVWMTAGTTGSALYRLGRSSAAPAAAVRVGDTGVPGLVALAADPVERVLYAATGDAELWRIDPDTAVAARVGRATVDLDNLAWVAGEGLVAMPSSGGVWRVDPETGGATPIAMGAGWDDAAAAWDPTRGSWIVIDELRRVFRVDPLTFQATSLGDLDLPGAGHLRLAARRTIGAPELDAQGACPGDVVVHARGLTPGGRAVLARGVGPGADVVPAGPCEGLALEIGGARVVDVVRNGRGVVDAFAPRAGGPCDLPLQLVDLTTCVASPVLWP